MEAKLQLAQRSHIPQLLRFMQAFYAIDQYPFNVDTAEKNLDRFIENPDLGRIWVIGDKNQYIGYIILTFGFSFEYQGRDAFIDEFFLIPEVRGKGIGKKILETVINKTSSLGVKAIHLEVETHNEAGSRLYKSLDFKGNNRALLTRKL